MAQQTHDISTSEMETMRVARFQRLSGTDDAFLDSLLPSGRKRNFKLVAAGEGVIENPALRPAIQARHDLNMSWVLMPPGGGSNLHDHPGGEELFIPVDGAVTIYWGENGEHSLSLNKFDCISVPPGIMRGFRNDGDAPRLMLAIVGGGVAGGSRVKWHEDVLRKAADETGVVLGEDGMVRRLPHHPDDKRDRSVGLGKSS